MKKPKMVTIKVPLEFAGVVQGALSFALDTANGWPQALATAPDRMRCVDAICTALEQLRDARQKSAAPAGDGREGAR